MRMPWSTPVFLVHGIRDTAGDGRDGDWFRLVQQTLSPFFRSVNIRYREFHQPLAGGVKLFVWPRGPVLIAGYLGMIMDWPSMLVGLIWLLSALVLAEDARWRGQAINWHLLFLVTAVLSLTQGSAIVLAFLISKTWIGFALFQGLAWVVCLMESIESAPDGKLPQRHWAYCLPVLALPFGFAAYLWPVQAFTIAAALLVIVSLAEPHWRRSLAAECIRRQIVRQVPNPHIRPAVIAHSLGTVLAHRVIRQMDTQNWHRLVFIGSALPQKTRWIPPLGHDSVCMDEVYNEAARKDWYVWLLKRAEPFLGRWTGLGGAGHSGFVTHPADTGLIVHDVAGLLTWCPDCGDKSPRVDIHNLAVVEGQHSSALLNERHAEDAWLPFLWGFSPVAYRRFLDFCVAGAACQKNRDAAGFLQAANNAGRLCGAWRPGLPGRLTLLEYAEEMLRPQLGLPLPRTGINFWNDRPRLYYRLFEVLFESIATGFPEKSKPPAIRDVRLWRALCPQYSMEIALEVIFRDFASGRLSKYSRTVDG